MSRIKRRALVATGAAFALAPSIVRAQNKYDPGVTDKEIKLGHTNPYSGPLSAYGVIGKGITAYWNMVNDQGGINGRKINFITYDDGFQPPKTVEMVRKLVEDDQVFAIYQLLGTPTNTVVQKYLNQKKVPQLFVATGASKWGNPKEFPWTMGWQPDYATEAAIYAKHIMTNHPNGKVAMLYQNDDSGKDYLNGFIAGFGKNKDKFLIKTVSYEVTDPTVEMDDFEVDHHQFDDIAWPALAHRVPAFEALRVTSSWAGHYDYNVFDQNAFLGSCETVPNLILASGFSGHGLQHAPAVGRALAELIIFGEYRTIDVTPFSYARYTRGEPLREYNVI